MSDRELSTNLKAEGRQYLIVRQRRHLARMRGSESLRSGPRTLMTSEHPQERATKMCSKESKGTESMVCSIAIDQSAPCHPARIDDNPCFSPVGTGSSVHRSSFGRRGPPAAPCRSRFRPIRTDNACDSQEPLESTQNVCFLVFLLFLVD